MLAKGTNVFWTCWYNTTVNLTAVPGLSIVQPDCMFASFCKAEDVFEEKCFQCIVFQGKKGHFRVWRSQMTLRTQIGSRRATLQMLMCLLIAEITLNMCHLDPFDSCSCFPVKYFQPCYVNLNLQSNTRKVK